MITSSEVIEAAKILEKYRPKCWCGKDFKYYVLLPPSPGVHYVCEEHKNRLEVSKDASS